MPVYLFTFHAYRSWNADRPRGFVQRGRGIQPPNPNLAKYYDQQAVQPEMSFGETEQRVLTWVTHDICQRREWRLHYVAIEATHVHILVSWRSNVSWRPVRDRLKNVASLELGRQTGRTGTRWFSRGASRKRVGNRRHFDYLMTHYLPSHRGVLWREGEPVPEKPAWQKPPAPAGG